MYTHLYIYICAHLGVQSGLIMCFKQKMCDICVCICACMSVCLQVCVHANMHVYV